MPIVFAYIISLWYKIPKPRFLGSLPLLVGSESVCVSTKMHDGSGDQTVIPYIGSYWWLSIDCSGCDL